MIDVIACIKGLIHRVLDLNRDEFVVEAQITTALHHRRYPGTPNIKDETEMSAVWPVEVEEIKKVENMF